MNLSNCLMRATAALTAAALFAGCAASPLVDFGDVQQDVATRSGGKRLHWMRGGADDAEAQRGVQSLLKRQLTADSAAQIALLNNRSMQAEFEELGIARADYLQALLPKNPSLGFHLDRSSAGTSYEYQAVAEVMNLLLLPLTKKVAARQLEQTKLRVAANALELIADTKTAFYELQAHQQLLGRLKLIGHTNEAGLDIAQRQHEAGNITDLDLANQQALYSQSKVDLAQTQTRIRSGRERLNRLMGVWGADTNWKIGDTLPPVPDREVSLANLEKRAISERIDLALARQKVEAYGLALRVRAGTRFAPVEMQAGVHGEKESDSERRRGPTVDLRLPLFDFGQAAIPKLEAQYRQAQHELEAAAVNARSEVREARDLVVASRDLARFYDKTLLPQRLQIVNQTALHYNAMQVGPIDLLAAKERELATERGYVEAWRNYWIARIELERALVGRGGGGRRGAAGLGNSPAVGGQDDDRGAAGTANADPPISHVN